MTITALLLLGTGWVYYNEGLNDCVTPLCNTSVNGSSLYDDGFNSGIGYGVNLSIQRMLYYAQNCSVVRINYSNNIYGFVDATCIVKLQNGTVN
jgi:hypothetical protein